MIRSLRDVALAVDEGRAHSQRFFKNAGTTGDSQWHDWSFASGQPAYDARIGSALEFTPSVATGNDAIYFPGIPAGMERRLLGVDLVFTPGGTSATATSFAMYDLLGVYPLIDGDSTDTQAMDNTAAVPRYTEGVMAVLVNHVAPVIAAADAVVEYVNSAGDTKSVTWGATAYGQNKVNYTTSGSGSSGPLYCGLADNDAGIARINSLQFTTAPGGLWAIYLVKPLVRFNNRGSNGVAVPSSTAETSFITSNGFHLPLIKDGATLGMFFMPATGARTVALHGQAHFVWG